MNLSNEDLEVIAKSISNYLHGKAQVVVGKGAFDSVTDEDVGFSFYKTSQRFMGNLKFAGTLNVKANFEGSVLGGNIMVQEEGTGNSITVAI